MKPRKRKRQTVRNASVEALEGRELLSGGIHALRHVAAQVLRMPHAHTRIGASAVPQGTVSTNYTFQNADGSVNGKALRNNLRIPTQVATAPSSNPLTSLPSSLALGGGQLNQLALQQAATGQGPGIVTGAVPVSSALPFLPIQFGGTSGAGASSVATSTAAASQVGATTTTIPTAVASTGGSTTTTTTTSTLPSTNTVWTTPTQSAPASVVAGTNVAIAPPGPAGVWAGGLIGNVPLSATDLASLKSAVDTFASAYTSGTNPSADSDAVTALQSSLKSLDTTVFSENHVVKASDVTAFQQAVNNFATNYTSGTSTSSDAAAWTALQSALESFGSAVHASDMPAGATVVSNGPMPIASGGLWLGTPGIGLTGLLNGIVSSGTLSASQVSTLKSGINTFASTYTSGTNTTTDTAAVTALSTSLDGLLTATPMSMPMQVPALRAGLLMNMTLTKAQVSTIQSAVDTFASTYTSGSDKTTDTAAFNTLESAIKGAVAPTSPTTSDASATPTTPPTVGDGGLFGMLANVTLSKTQVSALKSAVDTFASTYTNGAIPSTDAAALKEARTTLLTAFPDAPMAVPFQAGGAALMTTASGSGASGSGVVVGGTSSTPNGIG